MDTGQAIGVQQIYAAFKNFKFAVDESVGWLVQVSLTLFALTGSVTHVEGVNANSVRLTWTSQPTDSSTAI